MATCWSCNRVKGKRVCPARGGDLICSKCCGTKRRVEIQCPEDCPYLHGADPRWQSATRQKEEARFLVRFLELKEEQVPFLLFVHHLLLSTGSRFRSLTDTELAEVIDVTLKTVETRSKGIVYNHPTSSPRLDQLADWLAGVVAERANIATAPDVSDEDVRYVLAALGRAVRDHEANATIARAGYLATAEQVLHSSLEDAPRIELPDDLDELDDTPPNLIVSP